MTVVATLASPATASASQVPVLASKYQLWGLLRVSWFEFLFGFITEPKQEAKIRGVPLFYIQE